MMLGIVDRMCLPSQLPDVFKDMEKELDAIGGGALVGRSASQRAQR